MSRISRRNIIKGLSATAVLPVVGCATGPGASDISGATFSHGVASGDPDQSSVVLWTRVSGASGPVTGRWQLASDPHFAQVVAEGDFSTDASRDWTVKVVPDGLSAGERFYYRFNVGDIYSLPGRTRTLPSGHVERLGLAVASCSNHPFGYFNAYEAIALDQQVDLVLHLGDYIYEYGPDGYGGESGAALNRNHQPPREIVSLADYRQRHAQYKADAQSQAMHSNHPLIAIWDDHEITNDPWMDGAENHQPETEGDWTARKQIALQAYYEWMPIREPGAGGNRAEYWRHFGYGDLASLITLETRLTGRSEQLNYEDHLEQLQTADDVRRFYREDLWDPSRELLSDAGKAFTGEALAESVQAGRSWRILGNQILMARWLAPIITDQQLADMGVEPGTTLYEYAHRFRPLGEAGLPLNLDAWDGYPYARETLYGMASQAGANDLLVLTGDTHAFWQNQLFNADGQAMGVEIGTSGITSPGPFSGLGPEQAAAFDQVLADASPDVLWTSGQTNGYVRLVLTHEAATVDYMGVSSVVSRDYRPASIRQVRIEKSGKSLSFA